MDNEGNKSDNSNISSKLLLKCSFPITSSSSSQEDCFPRGCQFSPDGLCILTSQSNRLLLYNTHVSSSTTSTETTTAATTTTSKDNWKPALECQSGDSVRSYAWYPYMNSNEPASCCFAGVSR